jgi:hypothetical protein
MRSYDRREIEVKIIPQIIFTGNNLTSGGALSIKYLFLGILLFVKRCETSLPFLIKGGISGTRR